MKEIKFWSYLKSKLISSKRNLDSRLFYRITSNKSWPSLKQMRYLGEFIPKKEKVVLIICATIASISAVFWGIIFLFSHLEPSPANGGEYSEALIGQPKLINPLFSSINEVDADLTSLVYSGLFRFDKDQKLVPDLALEYNLSEDKKEYTVKIRPEIFWSDGEKFTVDDIVYTFRTIQDINVGSPLAATFQGLEVDKIDEQTIKFTLPEPFPHFLNTLTVGILPEHIWGETPASGMRLAKNNLQPVGTGAFVFKSLTKDETGNVQNFVLEKNDKYYGTSPYLDKITFKFFETYDQAIEALKSRKVKGLSFVPRKLKDRIPGKEFNFYQLQLPQYTAVFFNPSGNQSLSDKDLRLALAKATDKKTILQESLSGEGRILHSPSLNPELEKYSLENQISLNIDEANKLLDKKWKTIQPEDYFKLRKEKLTKEKISELSASSTAAITSSSPEYIKAEQDADMEARKEMNSEQPFYRQNKDGSILKITITTADTNEYQKAAEVLAKNWRKIGVQVEINSVPSRQINSEIIRDRNYDVLLYAAIVGSDPDLYPFWHSSQIKYPGLNLAMFSNQKADQILEKARSVGSVEDQNEYYKKLQDILNEEMPAIFLYTPTYTFAADSSIKGITDIKIFNPSDRYNNIGGWYIKTNKTWK